MAGTGDLAARYSDAVVSIDFSGHEVFVRGEYAALTNLEYRLLTCLVRHPGRALTYAELADWAWGPEHHTPGYVTWHIARLRRKVERDAANPESIMTIRGVGYRYAPPRRQRVGGGRRRPRPQGGG